jgi:hypothetical protein
MDNEPTPLPVLALSGVWIAVTFTVLSWLRATDTPPWWGWVLVVGLVVPGIAFSVRYEKRRRATTPEPDLETLEPRTFGDLPSIQKTRLVISTASSALLILVFGGLTILALARGSVGVADWAILLLPVLTALITAWLWWRLLHPNRRIAQQEQRIRRMGPGRVYLPLLVIVPAQGLSSLAFHAGSSEPLKFTYAFVVNAVLAAVLLAITETLRQKTSEPDRAPTPVW